MKLTSLNPEFINGSGDREGIGLMFDCPCGCTARAFVTFSNPLDGRGPFTEKFRPLWKRTGEYFETMTLTPSIHRIKNLGGCGWHGWLTNGELKSV